MSSQTATFRTAAQVRQDFLDHFKRLHSHTVVPSSPVVPHDDPTLLFTNAGMNQFKDVFLGQGDRPYTRAVDTQKCIRAGGKHNDLEDVGRDTYHHTFFEMLGNWSFGDYFKLEAIQWAWALLVDVWGLDPDRLYVTVFEGDVTDGTDADLEAEGYWKQFVPAERISRWGKKDNFWEMGDTGPCGPCSEIHFDSRSDEERAAVPGADLVNRDHPDVIEIWNLVFIQFNRDDTGTLHQLPDKHVDTGMGFERIVRVIQGKRSNYDTDIWTPIFEAIRVATKARAYTGDMDDPIDVAYRIIADHIRCLTIAITDGARPSNEGRGYVLRRILRRAVRHANQTLGAEGAVLFDLVPAVVESLGDAFPELRDDPTHVIEIIRDEENQFLRTLDQGMKLWWGAAGAALMAQSISEHESRKDPKPARLGLRGAMPAGTTDETDFRLRENAPPIDDNSLLVIREGDSWESFDSERTMPFKDLAAADVATLVHDAPLISGPHAFKLHDTFGFPIDLTRVMAEERGLSVDMDAYELCMAQARERSRQKSDGEKGFDLPPEAIARLRHLGITETSDDDKFHGRTLSAEVEMIWNGKDFDNQAQVGAEVALILNRTCFYAEQGGQVGDSGLVDAGVLDMGRSTTRGMAGETKGDGRFRVADTQRIGDYVLHLGRVTDGKIRVGDRIQARIDRERRDLIRGNHTATHLLNLALREVLGDGFDQKGSQVADDRFRFDFASSRAMTPEEVTDVQRLVNELIAQDLPVNTAEIPLETAQQITGVRAMFGERYPDPVRVVSIGPTISELKLKPDNPKWSDSSIEFCGGTHVEATGAAGRFVILSEQALAAGVRRITAVTGPAAMAANVAGMQLVERAEQADSLDGVALMAEIDEITSLVETLTVGLAVRQRLDAVLEPHRGRLRRFRKEAAAEGKAKVVDQARALAEAASGPVIVRRVEGADKETLLAAMDVIRSRCAESATMLFSGDEEESKVLIAAFVPEPLIKQGLKAGDWVREAARICGGGGGGRPDMAQAGGKDPAKIDDAITSSIKYAKVIIG